MARTINKLNLGKQLQLANYVKEHWNETAMTYEQFAVKAGEVLGFPISKVSVAKTVEALGFSSHRPKAVQTDVIVAYNDLRDRVEKLENIISSLLRSNLSNIEIGGSN